MRLFCQQSVVLVYRGVFHWIHEKYLRKVGIIFKCLNYWPLLIRTCYNLTSFNIVKTLQISPSWSVCPICLLLVGWRDYCEWEYKTKELWVKGSPHKCPGVLVLFSQAFKSLFIHNPKTRVYVERVTCFSLNDFPKQMLLLELFELINNKIMLPLLRFH